MKMHNDFTAVELFGVSIHPGSAKGIMKNASLMAMEFNSLLPGNEVPSQTEGYEGFHHLTGMKGDVEYAELNYIIRDHYRLKFEEKKEQFLANFFPSPINAFKNFTTLLF